MVGGGTAVVVGASGWRCGSGLCWVLGAETFPPWEPSCVEETGRERRQRIRLQGWWRLWWGNFGKIKKGFPEGVTLSWVFEGQEELTGQAGFTIVQVVSSVCVGVMLRGQGS